MAQKRMFSKVITESDEFLDMALSTQALYFHLGMQADDEGFVSPTRIMRMIGSQIDELKILITKGFIIPFENGVVVIRHWKVNNIIQKDRRKDTIYLKELSNLSQDKCGVYNLDTKCIQDVAVDKVSIGKVSIDKTRLDKKISIATASVADVFNFQDKLNSMLSSKDLRMSVISNYWLYRKITFENTQQYSAGLKRELRVAGLLLGYSLERIKEVMFWLNGQDWLDWTLETVHKYIDKDLNKLTEKYAERNTRKS